MKKTTKYATLFLTAVTLNAAVLPTITTVYAETSSQTTVTSSLSESQVNDLVSEVAKNHPDVSREWIQEVAERQLRGDYTLPPTQEATFRSAWQGITVQQAAVAIDVGIGLAISGGIGGLAAFIRGQGKHAAKSIVRSVVARVLGGRGGIVSEGVLDYALGLASPVTAIARWYDSIDKYPNNGRINI